MRSVGPDAYRRFAPEIFKDAYWTLRKKLGPAFDSMQIVTNEPLIPWEPMRPTREAESDDFLGTAFRIGRWHLNQGNNSPLDSPAQQQELREVVAIFPKYRGARALPATADELRGLKRLPGYRRIPARYASVRKLGSAKHCPKGITYFAGHGEAYADKSAARYPIELEDKSLDPLAWRALFHSSAGQPFVFFNACEIGQARRVDYFVEGWAPAALETGASGFVGGLWPLPDRSACDFALRFYEDLALALKRDGEASVAELLRRTRQRFNETGDPTYLAYVFYGDPELRFRLAHPDTGKDRVWPSLGEPAQRRR